MRIGVALAVLLALLALVAGATLWLATAPSVPPVPVASAEQPPSRPEVDPAIPQARRESAPDSATLAGVGEPTLAAEPAGSAAVAGWLRVEGRAPGEEVALQLGGPRGEGAREIVGRTRASPDGSFRFDGVEDDWSGAVVLPESYRLARPQEHGGDTLGFPARAGQLGLVIDVLRRPLLRGRVWAPDGTPLAQAYVLVEVRRERSTATWSARAAHDGRFERVLPADAVLRLSITCRSEDGGFLHRSWDADSLPAPDARGDIDVGDLRLAASDKAWVLVLDPDGAPFAGASVDEVASSGMRTVVTGADGRAEVVLAANVERFEVRADGYRLVELSRPAPGEEVVARLLPTHVLTIDVLDVRGEPWPHGRLRLRTAQYAFEGGRPEPATLRPDEDTSPSFEWGQDREGTFALFGTGKHGRVVWPGLVEGLDLELTLEDALGTVADHERIPGLAAGERRTVRLQLARETVRVNGRCVDASAQPIAGAKVEISAPGSGSTQAVADEAGRFESAPLLAERVSLRASAAGFADRTIEDVAPPAELTLLLRRGRTLQVVLRDVGGAPSPFGRLQARLDGTTWNSRSSTAGRHELADVPEDALEIEHTWHGRTQRVVVPHGVESFEWDLPRTGRLEVDVAPFPIGELESAHLVLEALDERGVVEQRLLEPGTPWNFRFDPWPGRYRLRCVVHAFTADAAGWRDPAGTRDVGVPVEVEVAADRIAQAVLENLE